MAHLGYFRAEFVERRRWLSELAFIELVALSQFLPGPASSQTGFGIGLLRGGYRGALAAWLGFTLPTALLLTLFAYGAAGIAETVWGEGLLHGLMLVAVAIVAHAVWGMARSFCPNRARAAIALAALVLLAFRSGSAGQIAALILGGVLGLMVCRGTLDPLTDDTPPPVSRGVGRACLAAYFALLGLAFVPIPSWSTTLFDAVYRSGALVFGGGHVVLPLLRDAVVAPGWVSRHRFPGGVWRGSGHAGPAIRLCRLSGRDRRVTTAGHCRCIDRDHCDLPAGYSGAVGALPFWFRLRRQPEAQAAMQGINAAVVGLLASALYDPVWTNAVHDPADFACVAVALSLLTVWRTPPLVVVVLCGSAGVLMALIR